MPSPTTFRRRGRLEELGIDAAFLGGLNACYSTFPLVCQTKYGILIHVISVEELDVRSPEG